MHIRPIAHQAEKLYLAALKTAEARDGGNPTKVLITIGALADLLMKKRDWNQAEDFSLRQLKMAEKMGFCDDDKFHALKCLTEITRAKEQFEAALARPSEGLSTVRKKLAQCQ